MNRSNAIVLASRCGLVATYARAMRGDSYRSNTPRRSTASPARLLAHCSDTATEAVVGNAPDPVISLLRGVQGCYRDNLMQNQQVAAQMEAVVSLIQLVWLHEPMLPPTPTEDDPC